MAVQDGAKLMDATESMYMARSGMSKSHHSTVRNILVKPLAMPSVDSAPWKEFPPTSSVSSTGNAESRTAFVMPRGRELLAIIIHGPVPRVSIL